MKKINETINELRQCVDVRIEGRRVKPPLRIILDIHDWYEKTNIPKVNPNKFRKHKR